jgi:GxxExxY protein
MNAAMQSNQPFAQEGYALMGAAFEVHNFLGGGLAEELYQQSLEVEMRIRKIPFRSKQELKVFYKGVELAKRSRSHGGPLMNADPR